jgi:hypothetical protein
MENFRELYRRALEELAHTCCPSGRSCTLEAMPKTPGKKCQECWDVDIRSEDEI